MIILDIELVHFGKFHNKRITFSHGLNVVYGKNEAGKSTIHAFIHCMLLGMDTGTAEGEDGYYSKFYPWDNQDGYGGTMRLKIGEHVYRIERSFLKEDSWMRLFDETSGQELTPADAQLRELMEGLNETNFINTISIEQLKCSSEPELTDELEHFICNAGQTKNIKLDMRRAQEKLALRAAELRRRYMEGADSEFCKCEEKLQEAKTEHSRLQEHQYQQKRKISMLQKKIEDTERQSAEEFLSYERERDNKRRQYEAAKKNWANAPAGAENRQRTYLPLFFFILIVLFAIGIGYLYMTQGLEEQMTIAAAAGFSVVIAVCLIGLVISLSFASKKKKRIFAENEIRRKLKEQFDSSAEQFEQFKKAVPQGADEVCSQMRQEIEELKKEIAQDEIGIEHWKKECDKLRIRRQQIRSSVADNQGIMQELEAVELASETLKTVAVRVQETFGNRLCKEASAILAKITDGKYDLIQMSEKHEIRVGTSERLYTLKNISRGTIEQVYLSIRVAAAGLLWQKSPMPFIFDNVFASYDDERLELAVKMLKDIGHQAIIFSSTIREDQLIEAK